MDRTKLSRDELVALLEEQERTLQAERESHRQQLRHNDMALQTKDQAIAELTRERDDYRLAFNRLMQQRFRNRSERYINNPDQLRLDFGDTDEAADAALGLGEAVEDVQTITEHKRRRPKKKRDESLPDHLERYEVVAPTPDSVKRCETHGERTLLPESMWDRTETLEFERPRLRVRVTRYPKYSCPGQPECGVQSPERPTSIVEGNRYDSSIAAEIITGKYAYHLPLYRLQDYFAGCGWTPSRSTQCNILKNVLFLVEPLLEHFKRTLQADRWIGCDDTGLTLLYPKSLPTFDLADPKQCRIHEVFTAALAEGKSSINAKMWAYRGVTVKLNLFDFTVSRHRDGPQLFFSDFQGTLLGDCWQGFEAITVASDGRMVRAACNSHARRKFEESSSYPDDRKQWLLWYQQLFDIEDRAKAMTAAKRLELRQREARPLWDRIRRWLDDVELRTTNVILPKSDMAKAINYVRNHFAELQRYLDDGMLPIDNNETEQLMRQVALGRKNWLFAGSVAGGERNAAFLTLATSAIRNDLDVWAYVKDCLDQLLSGSTNYDALLPWNWAKSHPDAIRQYRVEERQGRASSKRSKRSERRKRLARLEAKRRK
jgi:transposase